MLGMMSFTWSTIWTRNGCGGRALVLLNLLIVLVVKGLSVLLPLILKEVVDAMICVEEPGLEDGANESNGKCRSEYDTYVLIILYAFCKLAMDTFNYIREVPYAIMASQAEISIAHDVYNQVQRQSLAFHLNRETGKIIRMVSRGS